MSKDYSKLVMVTVEPRFVPEQSDATHQKYVWSYEVAIINKSDEIFQLLHRYWRITDMNGKIEEVHGAGVVGLQPLLKPGKRFTYTSYCQLGAPQGTMEGHYELQDLSEHHFAIAIPKFILTGPVAVTQDYRSKLH